MADHRPFLEAIRASLDEDGLRLIYADWLQEHDEPDRAEFIRIQCELDPIRHRLEDDRVEALREREADLLRRHREPWLEELIKLLGQHRYCPHVIFRRGFVDIIQLPVQWYLRHGEAVHELFPLLRRMQLFRVAGWGERLAQSAVPERLEELEIPCWIREADAEAIAGSPHLSHLSKLHLWLGNIDDEGADEAVCRALARCSDWPRLVELRLTAVCDNPEEHRPAFDRLAQTLGPTAVFVNPWSRPYVFSPRGGFRRNFPGRLPNGEQVFLIWPPNIGIRPYSERRSQILLRYDAEGNPVGETEVAFPADCLLEKYEGVAREDDMLRRQGAFLRESLGHQPAVIRVRSMRLGDYWLVGNYPYSDPSPMGHPDDPEYSPEQDSYWGPEGMGGSVHDWVSSGHFTFSDNGGDHWVNDRGVVCAT
jgi:uncharacterized protein (TIGR02996 family)